MGAPDLLQGLRRAGIALSVLPSGDLAVQPASKLTQDQRAAIKSHKAAIVQALQHPDEARQKEAFEERAAIIEHDGGMPREQAEHIAAEIHGEPLDPDRLCWPQTEAMNTAEIDTFNGRLHLFTRHSLDYTEAEMLAAGLVLRDRGADDRRLCLECLHLRGCGTYWTCEQWRRAGLAVSGVPAETVKLLQRCDGFKESIQ